MFRIVTGIGTLAKILRLGHTWPLGVLLVPVLAIACSSASPTTTPLPSGPEFSVVVVGTDLSLGSNRVVFGLLDRKGMPLRTQEAGVEALYLPPGQTEGEVRTTAEARFVQWPLGNQGVFRTTLVFDQVGLCTTESPGCWALRVTTTAPDDTPVVAEGSFRVKERSNTPTIGEPAPASVTPTVDDVDDLTSITSSPDPDLDLYRLSVHEALQADKPLVVVFATPAFCVTATCGPQVEVISQLKELFSGKANFIHVEVYKNPHVIEDGRPSGGVVTAVSEWNLPSEPWTFIVDRDGLVRAKFEAFSALEELQEALAQVVGS